MSDINTLVIKGRLTRDPELKYTPKGTAVANVGIAVNRRFSKDKEETGFFDVEVWAKAAEAIAKYLKKGDPVLIEGSLKQQRWEKDGQKFSRVTISCFQWHFCGGQSNRAVSDDAAPAPADGSQPPGDDDVPF